MVHYNLHITGKVQGVFFRAQTKKKAESLGLNGTVSNQIDGSVYVEVEGENNQLEDFIKWCHQGPVLAKIKSVKITKGPVVNFQDFSIKG